MNYKEETLDLRKEVEKLKIKLNAKEQVISIFYNLLKDVVFWNRT